MISKDEKSLVQTLFIENEEWLMNQILFYAEEYEYTKYTSTLKEAWRLSIVGLINSFIKLLESYDTPPELGPDEDYSNDSASSFGLIEARKHRSRGVNLSMFFSLFKYYRQSFFDLLEKEKDRFQDISYFKLFLDRFFDRIELAYCSEWAGTSSEKQIHDLSQTNLEMTNEKNKYLTIFDSIGTPIILLNRAGLIENMNFEAQKIFEESQISGGHYYDQDKTEKKCVWLEDEIDTVLNEKSESVSFEKEYFEKNLIFDVSISILHDVSHKFSGFTVIINNVTPIIKAQRKMQEAIVKQQEQEQILIKQSEELKEKNSLLEKLSVTDQLTKLFNRKKIDESIEEEINRAKRSNHQFGIILLDIDHFKKVNDVHGHQVGDIVLKEIAHILRSNSRETDIVGRWGGEEFLIIYPGANLEDVVNFAEIMRSKIETYKFPVINSKTASFGLTVYKEGDNHQSLIARADKALYQVKEHGRNKIEFSI